MSITELSAIKSITPKKFDDHQWIVNTDDGRNVLLNKQSFELLSILKNSSDEADAHQKFIEHFNRPLTQSDFSRLISTTFAPLTILDENVSSKKKEFLTLKIPLIKAQYAGLLASPFVKLFSQRVFWLILSVAFAFNILSLIFAPFDWFSVSPSSALLLSVLIGFSMPIHELGHIAACRNFGIKHGEIGFGFYLIFPIVYADITQIWNASKQQRIIANLGGIYLELIYSALLFSIHSIPGYDLLFWAAVGVFIKAITELNPFIRYDGYWLLSDISNTPNLMSRSKQAAHRFFSKLSKQNLNFQPLTRKEKLLTVYALSNMLIVLAYFVYVIVKYQKEILEFPVALYSLLLQVIHLEFSAMHFPEGFLWVLGLYVLTAKLILTFVVNKIKSSALVA